LGSRRAPLLLHPHGARHPEARHRTRREPGHPRVPGELRGARPRGAHGDERDPVTAAGDHHPATREPRVAAWLLPVAGAVLVVIGLLWALRPAGPTCRELYPPECIPATANGPAMAGGVLLVFGYAAFAVIATVVRGAARIPLLASALTVL